MNSRRWHDREKQYRPLREISLPNLRKELVRLERRIKGIAEAVNTEMTSLRKKVDGYTSDKYSEYMDRKRRYGAQVAAELRKWFSTDWKLVRQLDQSIDTYSPPSVTWPRGTSQEMAQLLADPSKWPLPSHVWERETDLVVRYRAGGTISRLDSIKREIVRREEAMARDAAAIAKQVSEESRAEDKELRRLLPRNHPCPYCGGPLGSSAHADHIHPIKKGGRSTFPNMVMVCDDCNGKKGNLTLQQFIRMYKLDRDRIEQALLALGKEF